MRNYEKTLREVNEILQSYGHSNVNNTFKYHVFAPMGRF